MWNLVGQEAAFSLFCGSVASYCPLGSGSSCQSLCEVRKMFVLFSLKIKFLDCVDCFYLKSKQC